MHNRHKEGRAGTVEEAAKEKDRRKVTSASHELRAPEGATPLGNHLKLVTKEYPAQSLPSIHFKEVYEYALAFIDRAEPTPHGGLAKAYRSRRGELLETFLAGDLMVAEHPFGYSQGSPALELAA